MNATGNVKQPQRLKRHVTAATSTFGIKTEQHGRATASVTVETHVRPVYMHGTRWTAAFQNKSCAELELDLFHNFLRFLSKYYYPSEL